MDISEKSQLFMLRNAKYPVVGRLVITDECETKIRTNFEFDDTECV